MPAVADNQIIIMVEVAAVPALEEVMVETEVQTLVHTRLVVEAVEQMTLAQMQQVLVAATEGMVNYQI